MNQVLSAEDTLTLLTATKDTRYSHAPLLAEAVRGEHVDKTIRCIA
ncbi:hypothetical protein ACFRMN_27940 [Streptomyces sp. NPDC056835]